MIGHNTTDHQDNDPSERKRERVCEGLVDRAKLFLTCINLKFRGSVTNQLP